VVLVGQRIFDRLQFGYRCEEGSTLISVTRKNARAEECLRAQQCIVVGFVAANLYIQVCEIAADPRRITRLIVAAEKIS
jgi:hypothetical protein